MKKLLIVIALITIVASIAAVRIETTYDSTIQGDLMYRDGKVFYIKTAHGKTPVLEEEIVKVYNSAGEDITTGFLNMPSTENPKEVDPKNNFYLVNAKTIAAPFWAMYVTAVGAAIYFLIKSK